MREAASRGTIDGFLFPHTSIMPYDLARHASAATVGENFGRHKIGARSLEGTVAFFAAACAAGFAARAFLHAPPPGALVAGAWCAALVELFLPRFANDNLVVPLVSAFAMTVLSPGA